LQKTTMRDFGGEPRGGKKKNSLSGAREKNRLSVCHDRERKGKKGERGNGPEPPGSEWRTPTVRSGKGRRGGKEKRGSLEQGGGGCSLNAPCSRGFHDSPRLQKIQSRRGEGKRRPFSPHPEREGEKAIALSSVEKVAPLCRSQEKTDAERRGQEQRPILVKEKGRKKSEKYRKEEKEEEHPRRWRRKRKGIVRLVDRKHRTMKERKEGGGGGGLVLRKGGKAEYKPERGTVLSGRHPGIRPQREGRASSLTSLKKEKKRKEKKHRSQAQKKRTAG